MRARWIFLAGFGAGYVLGARAGRERFDHMVAFARRTWESPTVQGAAGILQARAASLYDQGKRAFHQRYDDAGASNRSSGRSGRRRPSGRQPGGRESDRRATGERGPGERAPSEGGHPPHAANEAMTLPTTGPQTSRTDTVEAWDLSRRRRAFPADAF